MSSSRTGRGTAVSTGRGAEDFGAASPLAPSAASASDSSSRFFPFFLALSSSALGRRFLGSVSSVLALAMGAFDRARNSDDRTARHPIEYGRRLSTAQRPIRTFPPPIHHLARPDRFTTNTSSPRKPN